MPTFTTNPQVHSPVFTASEANSVVDAGVRVYTKDNQIGASYGAPMPLTSGVWNIGNAGGAGYGIESTAGSSGFLNLLPLTNKPGRALKIQLRGDLWPNAYTPNIFLLDPATNASIGFGANQYGISGMPGNFATTPTRGAWIELVVNISLTGYVSMSCSRWATGEAPGTHAPAETVSATSTARSSLYYPSLGVHLAVGDYSTTISEYKIWWGEPDPLPAGLAAIPAQTSAGWEYNSDRSLFPLGERTISGGTETWRRNSTMIRGGTHIALEFYGFYGKDELFITPASYTTTARVRTGAGPWTDFPVAVVSRGDIALVEVAYPHVAGQVVEIEGVATASHLPVMAGGYPFSVDDAGNTAGFSFGVLSKGFAADGKKSIIALTDSRGVYNAPQSIYALGHGCHNMTIGGLKITHAAGREGALKRQLLRRSKFIYIDLGANDLILDGATGPELAERHKMLLATEELQGAYILQASLSPVASATQASLPGSTWTLEKTQPRLLNSVGTSPYRFNEGLKTSTVKGAFIDLTGVTTEPVTGVWKAGISADGQHYTTAGNNAVKTIQQAGITAFLASLSSTGTGGSDVTFGSTTTVLVNNSTYVQVAPAGSIRLYNEKRTPLRLIVAASQPSPTAVGERIDELTNFRFEAVTSAPVWVRTERENFEVVVSVS